VWAGEEGGRWRPWRSFTVRGWSSGGENLEKGSVPKIGIWGNRGKGLSLNFEINRGEGGNREKGSVPKIGEG